MKVLLVEPNADPRAIEIDGSPHPCRPSLAVSFRPSIRSKIPSRRSERRRQADRPAAEPSLETPPETGEVYDVVYGTFFVCSAPSDSENFESLSDDLLEKYRKIFALPKLVYTYCGEEFLRGELYPFSGELSVRTVWKPKPFSALTAVSASGGMTMPEMNPRRCCQDCFDRHYTNCHSCG